MAANSSKKRDMKGQMRNYEDLGVGCGRVELAWKRERNRNHCLEVYLLICGEEEAFTVTSTIEEEKQ